MIIDVFSHVLPPRYLKERNARAGNAPFEPVRQILPRESGPHGSRRHGSARWIEYPDVVQLITIAGPNVESASSRRTPSYAPGSRTMRWPSSSRSIPDRFAGAAACLPMSDVDAALAEADRALDDFRFRGWKCSPDIRGQAAGLPEFLPLFEKMASHNLPILLHPRRTTPRPIIPGSNVSIPDLHQLRLAVRDVHGDGTPGLWWRSGEVSDALDHYAPCGRHDSRTSINA